MSIRKEKDGIHVNQNTTPSHEEQGAFSYFRTFLSASQATLKNIKQDKNEPARFLGDGVSFKAKLIGILEVNEARGDRMCQEALADLKMAIRAAGEHKQRININIAIDGLRLRDEKTGDCLYHHPVHKISFIAQDMSDSRAFGYIFGSPDTGHRFFGIKTDKAASQVVITMRDLFQVVFELKKKEIEMAKQQIEQHQIKYSSSLFPETVNKISLEPMKTRPIADNLGKETACAMEREENQEHIMDLLDLELELSNIQQGIHQMDRITPSDPFGPPVNVKPAALDPFGDSFNPLQVKTKIPPPPESGKKTKNVEKHWFDQETEALFEETDSRNSQKHVVSTSSISSSPLPPDAIIEESGLKKLESLLHREPFDVFTDLDPLGTGRSKPYIDKKDFFQDLKNPPKKVLKELACEPDGKHPNECDCETNSQLVSKSEQAKGAKSTLPNVFNDPFQEDPFDKDPFLEVDFSRNIFTPNSSNDPFEKFADFGSFESSKEEIVAEKSKSFEAESTPKQTPLRVSLPPEKLGNVDSVPMSPLQSRKLNRLQKNYTISCVIKPPSPVPKRNRIITQISGEQSDRSSPIMEGVTIRSRNPNVYPISSQSYSDITAPEPPPRSTLNALTMKPPPLPPKRLAISAIAKPPPRPPQSDYDYIENYHTTNYADVNSPPLPAPARKVKPQKANSEPEYYLQPFPLLPPPKKKNLSPKSSSREPQISPKNSVKNSLDITLSQLTKSGFSELAATLNMSPTSLSKMTLQDLTKCLTNLSNDFQNKEVLVKTNSLEQERTTNSESCSLRESVEEDSSPFTAEFDSHFSSVHEEKQEESLFDKYAVFRELLEEEKKQNLVPEQEETDGGHNVPTENDKVESQTTKNDKPSEDRYAALREICLEDSVEKYDADLSDKEDSVVEPSRLEEDIDLLPQSRQHSESTESPTITMKEHPSIIEATIIEEDISALDADEEVLEESIHETLKEGSKVYEIREDETEVKDARAVFSPETLESKDQTSSWAKFDADSELPLESRSSAHSEGHVSPWSTESKDNDLSPACDKRKHRKVKRHKQAVWHEDEESEEGWDMRLERSWSPSWKENGWSDGDSVYDETPPYIGREYHSPRRGRRRRISPWNSREQSPWEEDDRDCEDQWEKTRWKEEPRQRPKHRGPSWEEDRRRHFDDPRKPRKLWSEMDRKSSGESLTWDEEDRYQKRSYAERRRRKWDEDVHNRNRRWERDYEPGKISNRYYRHDHYDHEYDRAEEENPRWAQRPRSCERGRRQFSLHHSTESDYGERRYIRSRDGHSVDMDYRRKAHTLQSQKQRRKHNQTSPFEDDFTSQFTFKDVSPGGSDAFEETKDPQFDTTPKLFSQASHSSDFSREAKSSRSYQQSPFEDDFTPPEARRCSGRSASSELSDHREDVFFPNTNESRYKCESRRPKSAGQAESSLRKKNIKLFHTSESSSTGRDLPHPDSDQLEKTLAQHITDRKQCTDLKIRGHLKRSDSNTSLRKSESVNIFARNNDPFDDDFFSEENLKINRNRDKVLKNVSGESKWNESFDAFTFEEK